MESLTVYDAERAPSGKGQRESQFSVTPYFSVLSFLGEALVSVDGGRKT